MVGYSNHDTDISIGIKCPENTKRPCLVFRKGDKEVKVGTFTSVDLARRFIDTFADFMGLERIDWYDEVGENSKLRIDPNHNRWGY